MNRRGVTQLAREIVADEPALYWPLREPFSHSPSLAGQEAELTGGYERDDALYEDDLRDEILGWR